MLFVIASNSIRRHHIGPLFSLSFNCSDKGANQQNTKPAAGEKKPQVKPSFRPEEAEAEAEGRVRYCN
jgi:hypothetical protein